MSEGLCVVGSFMMDLIAYADRRPGPGETLAGTAFVQSPGGKGFNQAVAAARAGAAVSMVGMLGADSLADDFRSVLRAEHIDAAGVAADPAEGTGVGLPVVAADGQNSIVIIPRANLAITPGDVSARRSVIESAKVVLLQLELPMDAVIEAARIGRRSGAQVVLNPAPFAPLPDDLLALVDVVVPNEVEFDAWAGLQEPSDDERAVAARKLAAVHRCLIVVTVGARGALVVPADGSTPTPVSAPAVTVVDTIGAGDTFCGYLAAALSQGLAVEAAVNRAVAAGALAVTRRGGAASAPTDADVKAFLGGAPAAALP